MKAIVLFLVLMLTGCASMTLPSDATNQEKRAAACLDATAGLAMAQTALTEGKPLDGKTRDFWVAFQAAAQIAVATYCTVPSK